MQMPDGTMRFSSIEDLRRQISELCAPALHAGATAMKISGGQFQFENNVVVTFRPSDAPGHLCKTGREHLKPRKVPREQPASP